MPVFTFDEVQYLRDSVWIKPEQIKCINEMVKPWRRIATDLSKLPKIIQAPIDTVDIDVPPEEKPKFFTHTWKPWAVPLTKKDQALIDKLEATPRKTKSALQEKLDNMMFPEIENLNRVASDLDRGTRRYVSPSGDVIKYIPKDSGSQEPAFDWYVRKIPQDIVPNTAADYNPEDDVFAPEWKLPKLNQPRWTLRYTRCGWRRDIPAPVFSNWDVYGERTDIDPLREYLEDFDTSETGWLTGEDFVRSNFTLQSYLKWNDAAPVREYMRRKEKEAGIGQYIK